MPTVAIIVIIAVAILAIIAGLAMILAASRRRKLRQQLRPLSEEARASFLAQWPAIQERFVDQPDMAVAQARELVTSVLHERGHPAESYRQVAADLVPGYPQAAAHFKSAHQLSHQLSEAASDGAAPTEDLRQALIHYRATFDELVGGAPVRQGQNARAPYRADGTDGAGAAGGRGPASRAEPAGQVAPAAEPELAEAEPELAVADQDVGPADQLQSGSEAEEMRR